MIRPLRVATIDELSVEAFGGAMAVVFSVWAGIIFVYNAGQHGNRRRHPFGVTKRPSDDRNASALIGRLGSIG